MATEKLADALDVLHSLQNEGMVAINTNDISTVYRQRLMKNGFLKKVFKGWYIPASPDEMLGDSTSGMLTIGNFAAGILAESTVMDIFSLLIIHCSFIPEIKQYRLSY